MNKKSIISEAKAILWIILSVLLIKVTILEAYIVPTGSMENTIMTGDFLVGNRFVYGMRTPDRIGLMDFSTNLPSLKFPSFKEPKRGDVIIFKFPRDTRQKYVKRCVPEPADVLEIKDKIIYERSNSNDRVGKFPHLYDKFNINAVLNKWNITREAFSLPKEVLIEAEKNFN